MNFKRFGRTANLFDKANLEGGIYLASNGNKYGSITDGVRSGVKINVLPNTQYTLSLYSNMNISIRILQWSGETYITHTPKYNVSGNVSLTITTNSTTDKIAFNVEGVNGQYAENLMLNEGSTALPYQPYMDWTNTPHYIMGTSTDTITTPAVLYPNDTTATVGLKGQTVQSSVPSPTSPVMPQGCGNKTANLSNVSDYTNDNTDTRTYFALRILMSKNGSQTEAFLSSMQGTGEKSFSFTLTTEADTMRIVHNGSQRNLFIEELTGEFSGTYTYSFDLESNDPTTIGGLELNDIMLNTGSTAKPYEPYGYKIPISSANTTTPVYLGEVQTTRKIRKLVLTGEEAWTLQSINSYGIANLWTRLPVNYTNAHLGLSSHLTIQTTLIANTETEGFYLASGDVLYIRINATSVSTANELKSYLAAQYAAGTPVTVWYVLATEETGIVNEPLMKIGDYADTLSNISIPVTAGGDTLSVGTTVQPSEVTVNYKGWHPVQNVHEFTGSYTVGAMQALTIAQLQTHTISDLQGGEWL